MKSSPNEPTYSLSNADREELNKLVSVLELSDSTTTIFAIAPESEPQHPVVEELKSLLLESEEGFQFQNFFYSDNSLHNYLYGLDEVERQTDEVRSPQPPLKKGAIDGDEGEHRLVVMAFGIDQLPTPRLVREMKQLNLGRDSLFKRELVLIFWLNKVEFLDEFRHRAPDFWDWRGKVVQFEARPVFNPLFYPYLEWLIAENSYLKISGVMQVQRQVDIFLDQIYVSLQAVRRQQVTETSERGHRELEVMTSRHVGKGRHGGSALDEFELLDEVEPLVPDFVPTAVSTKTVTQKVDLSQAVRENQYCVILGAPGAGKTTLLRYLALHFGMAKRDGMERVAGGEGQEELGKPLLPVFFRIADYAERLNEQPDLSLLEYLRQFYRQWEAYFKTGTEVITSPPDLDPPLPPLTRGELERNAHPDLAPSLHSEGIPPQPPLLRGELELEGGGDADIPQLLCEQMQQGQCLMLLDGLDEVFDQESRRLIVERINQFVEVFSANKFVVTSRIAGYRDVKLSERFAEFTIEDMGSEQVEGFLHRWCRAVEQAQQPDANQEQWQRVGDEQTREILAAIQANEGVKRLTANPLLLTILALIHRNGSRLPHRRVELYALAVKTLTEDWQLGKKLPDAPKVMLKESEVVELLAPLAYWMHEEKPSGVVTQAEAEEQLAATLAELNDDEPDSESVRQAVEQFLRKVRETTGLFVERAPGVYGFMHLTFEEYFAARYIADHERSEILELIRKHLHEPRWDEPILLALGYYGSHFPKQVNKLVEELFSNLEGYKPAIQGGEIRIKNASSPDAILAWSALQDESATSNNPLELRLKDLLFAGEVLAQVEVNSRIRSKLLKKLILTYVGLRFNTQIDILRKILSLLGQIELFNNNGEVIEQLEQITNDSVLSDLMQIKVQLAILYVVCREPGASLTSYTTNLFSKLDPFVFGCIKLFLMMLGEEITPVLKATLQTQPCSTLSWQVLSILTAISYIRKDSVNEAVALLEKLNNQADNQLELFVIWALATCYAESQNDKAIIYYQQCLERFSKFADSKTLLIFWLEWGAYYHSNKQYEQSIECVQRILNVAQNSNQARVGFSSPCNIEALGRLVALALVAQSYQDWGKYEQAIEYYQKIHNFSQEIYRDEPVLAGYWNQLAGCYCDWSKYEQASECALKNLVRCQSLEDKPKIADAYFQLGRIYQGWGKFEEAIAYYKQSRDLYEQLGREKAVAKQWHNLADCYSDWGKYEQAIECELKNLAIRQQLEDQPNTAFAYWQLGRMYQAWGKYEEAITYRQRSRELYEQLDQQKNVANQWYWLADCYWASGKYEQAVECAHKDLAIRQQLEDQPNTACAYSQLGLIYQAWGMYEEAIAYYQQSRDLYEQLGKEKNVANLWYWLGDCYRNWDKYEQAVECQQQCLRLRQTIDDQSDLALSYYQLGRIYQAWGKYEQAIAHFQQSRELYEQLGKEKEVASQWYNLAGCYRKWGKYQQAEECELKGLAIRHQLDDQLGIASAYFQLGWIYQDWGKYEQAIAQFQQSRELYQQLGLQKNVANQLSNLANCYRDLKDYTKAIEYYQQSRDLHQQLGQDESVARRCRQIAYTQHLLAKNTPDTAEASNLLTQAEQNIHQAIQINTAGDYKGNLAYDYTTLGLLCSERLRLFPPNDSSLPEQIAQFEHYYNTGLTYLTELGQTVDRADEALNMARAYLEINALENLDRAEAVAQESLQIFQDYNRRELEAAARKLLGEIYLKRAQRNQSNAEATAHQFLSESLQIYRELDLTQKAAEVEQLMLANSGNGKQQ